MNHFVVDGFKGFRSRFDDIELVQELLEEIPHKLGLQPVMPPFILPYYNGVDPEDCGISAFTNLVGGHLSLHTFSYRECFFADLVSPMQFSSEKLETLLKIGLPCATINSHTIQRSPSMNSDYKPNINANNDFGPHLFIDITDYQGPSTMDDLFDLFDSLPSQIGMTPIMRPYAIKGLTPEGKRILSIITMIAESHVSLHVFLDDCKAFFDLFSCRFFDEKTVIEKLYMMLPGKHWNTTLFSRGTNYNGTRNNRITNIQKSKAWLLAMINNNRDMGGNNAGTAS